MERDSQGEGRALSQRRGGDAGQAGNKMQTDKLASNNTLEFSNSSVRLFFFLFLETTFRMCQSIEVESNTKAHFDHPTTSSSLISSPSQTTLESALGHSSSRRAVKEELAAPPPIPQQKTRTQEPYKHWHRTQLLQLQ